MNIFNDGFTSCYVLKELDTATFFYNISVQQLFLFAGKPSDNSNILYAHPNDALQCLWENDAYLLQVVGCDLYQNKS